MWTVNGVNVWNSIRAKAYRKNKHLRPLHRIDSLDTANNDTKTKISRKYWTAVTNKITKQQYSLPTIHSDRNELQIPKSCWAKAMVTMVAWCSHYHVLIDQRYSSITHLITTSRGVCLSAGKLLITRSTQPSIPLWYAKRVLTCLAEVKVCWSSKWGLGTLQLLELPRFYVWLRTQRNGHCTHCNFQHTLAWQLK